MNRATIVAPLLLCSTVLAFHARGQGRASLPPQLLGPIVGATTATDCTLWMHAGPNPDVVVQFRSLADPPDRVQAVRPKADPAQHDAIKARLTGLKPSTAYRYEVLVSGQSDEAWRGKFTTPPAVGQPGRFKLAVSSCMDAKLNPVQSAWYLMLCEAPQLQLLLGDNVYANSTDREVLWSRHREQRRVVEFAAVARNTPTYAIWDDHDYGPNDSDGTQPGKENSLATFKELFANPSAGTSDIPGVFYKFSWGDVDFFMLDGRYHRSPDKAPNDSTKRMLGDAQFRWLADGLRDSKAKFKVLASGSTLMASLDDGWRIYDYDRNRLYETIMGQKIPGVLYLSGDIHRCQLEVHGSDETHGYPLIEVISSGIANSKAQGFATLEFDTTQSDPSVRVKIIHGDATTRLDRTFRLSEMQIR